MPRKYVGVNKMGYVRMGGVDSSYSEYFTDQKVLIANGIGDIIPAVMGDVSIVCEAFKKTIEEKGISDFDEIAKYLYSTVTSYFGDFSNVENRLGYFYTLDEIKSDDDITHVAGLKGLNAAMCMERAMLAQNLLKTIGVNSYFKSTAIERRGELEAHSYNLAEYDGKYYLVDTTIPRKVNEELTPVIAEIPKEAFEKLSSPEAKDGYSIKTRNFSVYSMQYLDVVYDPGREQEFDSTIEARDMHEDDDGER